MDQQERHEIRSANDHLKDVLAEVQGEFDQEMAEFGEVNRKLSEMKVHATSPNNLARVTVDSTGVVVNVEIAEDAYRRSTPKQLSQDLNATIRGAVEAVSEARAQITAPLKALVDKMPDLDEVVPGAPSLRDVRAQLAEQPDSPQR
jgi:DNA-binding protein YbaB